MRKSQRGDVRYWEFLRAMSRPVVLDTLPEVRLLEDITRESAARLITELSAYKGTRVALSIFSNGGDVHGSQAVAAYIGNPANEMQVEARIYGNAASGAMIIAAACQKAYIASGAFALIHKAAAIGPDGKRIPVQMQGGSNSPNITVTVNSQTGDPAEIRRSAASGARTALGIMSGARRYG